MPEGLEIDHSRSLEGTMSPYAQHLLISTGQSDWKSRIEDEKDSPAAWGGLVGEVKALLGRGGEFFDVCRCSFYLLGSSIVVCPFASYVRRLSHMMGCHSVL